jgi:flagellar basal-body rod modification protein FlgD
MADDISAISSLASNNRSASQQASVTGFAEDFDDFLTLLTTQLQNQDPLSPMDTTEFTNQLVMFADVEQSINQSGLLEDLVNVNAQNQASAAVSYIGRQIEFDHNEVNYTGEPVVLGYSLPEDATQATMEIYDSSGELIRIIGGIEQSFGDHAVEWDGLDQQGNPVAQGAYSFQVGVVNDDDQPIEASYMSEGVVTGIEYNAGETTLMMGTVGVKLENVLRVEDPPAV